MAGLVMAVVNTWKPPAKCSHRNQSGQDQVAITAKQVHKDYKFKDMSSIQAVAVITNDDKNMNSGSQSYKVAITSPLAKKWDMVTKSKLNAVGQHQVFGHFIVLPDVRKHVMSY
jgi:hypothetical protein